MGGLMYAKHWGWWTDVCEARTDDEPEEDRE